tara:strand:- start:183 stop:578 length:396 start_codon:yes stop_codon:yes gene_type:complete
MKLKYKERNKHTHIRNNIFDLPTGELEKPLRSGKEVFEFILKHANKDRYAFKGRGRGSRKEHGNSYGIRIEHAEKIALYVHQKDHITQKEQEERARGKSAWEIHWKLRDLEKLVNEHNLNFDNDIELEVDE